MSDITLTPTQERLIIAQFSSLAHLPPGLLINLMLHALADHLATHQRLSIPFHVVTGCNRCPFAQPHENVTPGPWAGA